MIGGGVFRSFVGQVNTIKAAVLAVVAGSGGAALVGAIQSGTGAVPRTVLEFLRDGRAASVKDFGAVGDGVADDTAAIQAAIDAVASAASIYTRKLRFPRGNYLVTAQLSWPDGVVWEGDYGFYAQSPGNNVQQAAIVWGGAAGATVIVAPSSATHFFGYKMRNLRFLATGNRPATWVQFMDRCDSLTGFEDVQFVKSSSYAVRFELGGINVYIRGGRFDMCRGIYWNVQGLDNLSVQDITMDHAVAVAGEASQFLTADHTTSTTGARLSFTLKNINIEANSNLAAGTAYFEFIPRTDALGYQFPFRGTFESVLIKSPAGVTEKMGIKVSPAHDRVAFTFINSVLTWTGIPSAPMYDATKNSNPLTVLAPHGPLENPSPATEHNTIDLRGDVNFRHLMQYGKQAISTLYAGAADAFWNTNPTTLITGQWVFDPADVNAAHRKVKEVVTAGTLGVLAGVTGSGNVGTNALTVNDPSMLRVGHWIKLVGDAGAHKIATIDYTTGALLLANNLGATVAAAAVSFSAPVYRDHTLLTTFEGSVVWDPASIANGAQASTTVTATGAAVGDQVVVSASIALSGMHLWGEVTAADTVTVYASNATGAAVDRPSLTVFATVFKRA